MKRKVSELIRQQSLQDFATVRPDAKISEALAVLLMTRSSALLVVKNGRLKGVFSEKDFAKASLTKGYVLSDPVESVMTSRIYYAEPTFTLEECLHIMTKVHVRHLPVLDRDTPIAMLSMRHIMEALVADQENQIRDLTSYITGPCTILDFDQSKRNPSRIPIYSPLHCPDAVN
jgi:CBS domain-containing protein